MQFLKSVWSVVVGVKDALVLLFLLLLFGGLWAALSSQSPRINVPEGAALLIDLDGALVDQVAPQSPLALIAGETMIPETDARLLAKAIDTAAKDDSIRMIVLDLDGFLGGGLANLESVGAALARFKAAGKTVEAWATAYGDDGYYLAAHASRIHLAPMGAVLLTGPGGSSLFFKEALDRLKVNVEVFRVGAYKSFAEPFTRTDRSPEAREADQALVDDLWANWRAGVQRQRPGLDVAALLESWPARVAGANQDQAALARDAGLVDAVIDRVAWRSSLRERLGEGDDPDVDTDFKHVELRDYLAARRDLSESGPAVGIVHVSGTIVDGEAPAGQAGGDSIARLIEEATDDDDIKALVVRIDSGGGSATASERIRLAMLEARARKLPVIASFGPAAASGGYWVGTGADVIYASPSSITGSIGVFGIVPTFERTLGDLGITSDEIRTTALSGQPDIVGGLNDETRGFIQASVGEVYRKFTALVAGARKMPAADVEAIAGGRVWSGARAKQLGLVDAFGGLDAAVREAARRAKIEGEPRVVVVEGARPFLARLLGELEGTRAMPMDPLRLAALRARSRALAEAETALRVAEGPTVQAHCLTCLVDAAPRSAQPTSIGRAIAARLAR